MYKKLSKNQFVKCVHLVLFSRLSDDYKRLLSLAMVYYALSKPLPVSCLDQIEEMFDCSELYNYYHA